MKYIGYVYLWYDTKSKFFYIGGHKGKVNDSYICSSKTMKRAYIKRPETFKMKVLEYVYEDSKLRTTEQKWLNMIKDSELMISKNVLAKTCRYYNVKKNSVGGNGVGTNKGKSHEPWNKGKKMSKEYCDRMSRQLKGKKKSAKHIENIRQALVNRSYESAMYVYELTSPRGEVNFTYNLNQFCKDYGLNQGNMAGVISGRHKSCKGWKGRRINSSAFQFDSVAKLK